MHILYPMYRTLRWLLQVDHPAPARTQVEWEAEVERHYRWNYLVNLFDGVWFWFGISFISSTTIVPLFVSKLTTEPLFIALAAMIAQGSWFLPQLLTANVVERLPRKKAMVVNAGLFLERLPMFVLVAAAAAAAISPTLALVLFFVGYAWHGLGAGTVATSWQDLMARCFPVERRGGFLGVTMFLGAGVGALGAFLSAYLLERFAFPTNFFYLFLISAVAMVMSWVSISLTREPLQASAALRRDRSAMLSDVLTILRQDHNFRRFVIARLLLVLGGMGSGFVAVAAVQRWGISDSQVGLFTAEYLLGQTVANLVLGFMADRFGHKLSLEIGTLAAAVAFGLAWLAQAPWWYDAAFVAMGIFSGSTIVSGILLVLEFAPDHRRPTYAGLANTLVGVVSMIGPLLGAALASFSYELLFALSAFFFVIGLAALRLWVAEPRWESGRAGDQETGRPGNREK